METKWRQKSGKKPWYVWMLSDKERMMNGNKTGDKAFKKRLIYGIKDMLTVAGYNQTPSKNSRWRRSAVE